MKSIANTTIRLGLINLPVQVCQAVESSGEVKFVQAGPNGEGLRQAYLMPDGKECPKDEIQKGIMDGTVFWPVDAEAIEQINTATKLPDLNITDVVDRDTFDSEAYRITGLYYVQANLKAGGINAFKLFVDALEEEGKCLVTKWTARSRQKLLVMYPEGGVLKANSLCFEGDVREPDESVKAHMEGTYSDKEKEMAKQMLNMLAANPSNTLKMETDEAVPLRNKLVEDARNGIAISATDVSEASPTEGALEDALAASLAAMQ